MLISSRKFYNSVAEKTDLAIQFGNDTLKDVVINFLTSGKVPKEQAKSLLRYCTVYLDGVKIQQDKWSKIYPQHGSMIHIYEGAKGGGGGSSSKGIIGALAMVAVSVFAVWAGPALATAIGGSLISTTAAGTALTTAGTLVAGITTAAIMTGGSLLVSALFPQAKPKSISGVDYGSQSPAYSISGATNSINAEGYIPVIFGENKVTPPLGGKSWTNWQGSDQYFNMLVIWGQSDLEVSNFKIDKTDLGDFKNVEHIFHQSTTGSNLKLFGKSPNEKTVGAELNQTSGWISRTVGEANDLSVDIQFSGFYGINSENGSLYSISVEFAVEYKNILSDTWINFLDSSTITYTNGNRELKVYNLKKEDLNLATYEVRIKRISADRDSQYIQDKAVWSTMRAFKNIPAFNSPVPLCVSELRIKATEQLSGYVQNFNAICKSKALDYDLATDKWIYRPTNNPASLALYALTSANCLIEPFKDKNIDYATFEEFHTFCDKNNYTFNFIGDTETKLWDRLIEITAVGRGAITTDVDGKWGIIIDQSEKEVKQMFTPRNSWGINKSRTFANMPHALRVSFINAEDDYTFDEQYVFWDGYSLDGANGTIKAWDIIPWDYTGVTDWDNLYKLGRYHLAKLLHRQASITINTDWEWLACNRGDVVSLVHDTLLNTFGGGYIVGLIYEIDGEQVLVTDENDKPDNLTPIGLQLDDTLIYSVEGQRYGIDIRYSNGSISTYELIPIFDNQEHKNLYFKYEVASQNVPKIGDLCNVSFFGQKGQKYLFAGVTPGERLSAEINLIPYAMEEIETAASGLIPPYNPVIIIPGIASSSLPTPTIMTIKSNEDVLLVTNSGTVPILKVWAGIGITGIDTSTVVLEIKAKNISTEETLTSIGSKGSLIAEMQNVIEKEIYEIRIRLLDYNSGKSSNWSASVQHQIVGRTTPPPKPTAVYMDGSILRIEQLLRPLDFVGHVIYVGQDENDDISQSVKITNPYTMDNNYDLSAYQGRARIVYVQAIDEIGLLSEPVFIKINLGDVIPDNVIVEISEKSKNWNGEIINGKIDINNYLTSLSTTNLFPQKNDLVLFTQENSLALFPSGMWSTLQYIYIIYIIDSYLGANLFIESLIESGKIQTIEYRLFQFVNLFSQENDLTLFPQENDLPLFSQDSLTQWQLMPDKIHLVRKEKYQFRITVNNQNLAIFDDIITKIDVLDKEQIISDLSISSDGTTRIPIKQNYFRKITNIQITLQYLEGDTGINAEFIRNSEIYEGDFIKQGTVIIVTDSQKQLTAGNVDITIKGY